MKKQQHILTIIIILAVIGLFILMASIIYDENVRENKKAVESSEVPVDISNEDESQDIEEPFQEENAVDNEEYIGEEEKETQKEENKIVENKDEKAIELAQKEWGEDDSVSFSIEKKKDTKYYISVKQNATVRQWYEVDITNWEIREY